MAISLYDVSVASFRQTVGAVVKILDKGLAHCQANNIDLNAVVETRLHPDMLPFRFQILSVAHHSLGAVHGVQAGVFKPPSGAMDQDYAALQKLIADTNTALAQFTRVDVDALEGKDVVFQLGEMKMPFTAEGFLASFSLPNMYFHAATAYDILRMKGVPLGKRDFMGQPRMKG